MDTNNPVVKIDHLKFNYKKHIVFEDLSLELEAGRIYGLLGENGVAAIPKCSRTSTSSPSCSSPLPSP